jgi:beta-galactosidase
MYKKYFFLFVCLFVIQQLVAQQVPVRVKYNFNTGWKLQLGDDSLAKEVLYNDKGWKSISLPHAFNEDDAFKNSIADLTIGIAWYRKHFSIGKEHRNKKVFIEFEGIRHAGEFYLNGVFIGRSENGVMAFGFDISNIINWNGNNVLAARIDNSWSYREKSSNSPYQWNDRNFYANYGGINKNVYLHVMGKLYQTLPLYSNLKTTGVYIAAADFDITNHTAVITAQTEVRNEHSKPMQVVYEVVVEDAVTGIKIAKGNGCNFTIAAGATRQLQLKLAVNQLNFWSWGYGYLYNVYTILKEGKNTIDQVKTVTGFRKTEFKNGMLYLNDRAIHLKGYAQRTTNEWPAVGSAVPAWMSDYSNHLMVASNANLVRWMHVTPWKQDVESCDRVGLMQAMPAGDSEKDVEGRRWEHRIEVMRDAIIYNRNNPSIIFYECGNNAISEGHMQAMKAIRDIYDPLGARAIGSRNMLDSKVAEYGGEMLYINKSAGKPMWQMEYSRDEGLRKYWDEYSPPYHKEGAGPLYKGADASSYNHNQDAHAIENIARWYDYWQERPGTGDRVNGGGVNIVFSESNTHYRGEENYRRSGEVDALRIQKDGYYAHKVMWDGWVNNEKPGIHILGHWNYAAGVVKDMYVVSSAAKVELFVNGKSMGMGEQRNHFLFTFKNIVWQPGIIKAIGYDANGKKLTTAMHETAGSPYALRLTQISAVNSFTANGADLALFEIEVVDVQARRCPTALNMIHFTLNGAATWRGGMAQGPDNFILSDTLPVECGVNRILIRATDQPGVITLTANATGLKTARIQISSKPFKQVNGLSLQMPSDGLKPLLDKGPTPAAPSFTAIRTTLKVKATKAGANSDKAVASYDDNEASDWVNDGQLATAWVEYELENVSAVSEVALKLNNFRTRTYPVKISVDGQVVFKDTTTRNLGYFTARFAPAKGRIIKIELYATGEIKEVMGTEVNGKKLDDGVIRNDANAKGIFSIIEAEFYQIKQ